MTSNGPQHLPNSIHFNNGTTHFSDHFGGVYSITPHCLSGHGHDPCIQVRFTFGLRVDFTPADFADLLRQGPEALARLPFIPDVHDAILDGDT